MFLDAYIEHTFYVARAPFFVKFFSVATELGGGLVVAALSITLAVFWFRQNRLPYIAGLFVSVVGSGVVAQIIKYLVERPRPLMPAIVETGYSFPSGHGAAALALYGFLVFVIWNTMPPKSRNVWVTLMGTFILLIGFSRLYLGVHYFSDVVGGYVIGAFFVWLGILISKRVSHQSI